MQILDVVNIVKFSSHRGNQSLTTDQVTTDILNCMNRAWTDLARMLPRDAFRFDGPDLTTVIGTAKYSLSGYNPAVFEFIQFWFTDANNALFLLERVPSEREYYANIYSPTTPNNRPNYYLPKGIDNSGNRLIELFPVPDAVYTIHNSYYGDLTSVDFKTYSITAPVPYLPSYLQEPLWKGTLYYYLSGYDDPMKQTAKAEYEQAKLEQETAQQEAKDEDTQWRIAKASYTNVSPANKIRLI